MGDKGEVRVKQQERKQPGGLPERLKQELRRRQIAGRLKEVGKRPLPEKAGGEDGPGGQVPNGGKE